MRQSPRGNRHDGHLVRCDPRRQDQAALAGLILATPVAMSQVWLFIAPGLYAQEKKFAIPFVVFASFFFIAGTLFGHYILLQVAWAFFAGFGAENEYVAFTPRLQDAFSPYVRLVLACGVISSSRPWSSSWPGWASPRRSS